jgi:integral membrane sensor domain MASE1
MPDYFREQPKLRLVVGAVITVLVWVLYLVRAVFGMGPMHDKEGNQAPALHYLAGALIVTGMVMVWIIVQAIIAHHKSRSKKPPDRQA